ncbi:MAG: hypothetical protein ACOVSW_03970 [Candidatus Kapaibacteriota bacterium]
MEKIFPETRRTAKKPPDGETAPSLTLLTLRTQTLHEPRHPAAS